MNRALFMSVFSGKITGALRAGVVCGGLIVGMVGPGTAGLHAHQPFESSAQARIGAGELELTVTTSLEIAGRLVGSPLSSDGSIDQIRPQLVKLAAELYEVNSSVGKLDPERTFFTLRNGESVFSAIYQVGSIAEFRLRAAYLTKLPVGYGGLLVVLDGQGKVIGGPALLKPGAEKDTLLVRVPLPAASNNTGAEPAKPASTDEVGIAAESGSSPAGSPLNAQASNASPHRKAWLFFGFCMVVFMIGIGLRFRPRSQ